jgi:hypothetical protein
MKECPMKIFGSVSIRKVAVVSACALAAAGIGVLLPGAASAASTPRCRQGLDLRINFGSGEGAAGSTYRQLEFHNISGHSCYLDGHPGVSYVNSAGTQVGPAATKTGAIHDVVLAAGKTGYATLRVVQYLNYANCTVANVAGFRVYPPGSTASSFVADAGKTCSNKQILSISAVSLTQGG